jgi:hypothetical protein
VIVGCARTETREFITAAKAGFAAQSTESRISRLDALSAQTTTIKSGNIRRRNMLKARIIDTTV